MKKLTRIAALTITLISMFFSPTSYGQGMNRIVAPSPPDPYVLNNNIIGALGAFYLQTLGNSVRPITINPAQKTLVLLIGGQSQGESLQTTLYLPANGAVVSHLNIDDGQFYPIIGPLLGANYITTGAPYGPGNMTVRLSDDLIAAGWNQVLLVNFTVGNTQVADWAAGGALYGRSAVAMARLAALGITPSTPGVTFCFLFIQGESDNLLSTPGATYAAGLQSVYAKLDSTGFVGRKFQPEETWIAGAPSATIEAAQIAAVDNVKVFSAGNLDALGASDRFADLVHFNDTGAPIAASTISTAMHASGAPFLWQPPYAANDNWQALEGCNDNTSDLCKAM